MNKNITQNLSEDELHIIYSSLNEVCNALGIEEFEIRIGYPDEQVRELMKKIGKAIDNINITQK